MFGLNNAQLIGRLGADATISHLTNGGRVANVSIATDESFLDKNSGDKVDRTEWHRIVTFQDGLVEMMEKHAKKGRLVYVSGKLQTRKWRKDGEDSDRFSTEILLVPGGRVQFLDKPNGNGAPAMNGETVPSAETAATVDDSETPWSSPVRPLHPSRYGMRFPFSEMPAGPRTRSRRTCVRSRQPVRGPDRTGSPSRPAWPRAPGWRSGRSKVFRMH